MRNQKVDALKGYACFLVLFGHVIMGVRKCGINIPWGMEWVEKFIWTFHVALFMFLSGYVYRLTGEWKSKNGRLLFLRHKLVNLAVPYFVFSSIYICINSLVGGANVNNESQIADILWLWKESVAQYWFLYDLFFLFVSFTVLSKWLNNVQITILLFIIKIVVTFALGITLPEPFDSMISMVLPFGIGTCIDKLYIDEQSTLKKIAVIFSHIVILYFVLSYSLEQNMLIDSLIGVIGIVSSIAFISSITKCEFVKKILLFICKYSFPIYLLHTIFTAGIRVFLNKLGLDIYWLHVALGTAAGLFFPVIGAEICNKIDVLNFFFYPEKIVKKWKQKKQERI